MFRKKSEKEHEDKLNGLQEKFAEGTAALQQSIGGVTNQVASQVEKVRRNALLDRVCQMIPRNDCSDKKSLSLLSFFVFTCVCRC